MSDHTGRCASKGLDNSSATEVEADESMARAIEQEFKRNYCMEATGVLNALYDKRSRSLRIYVDGKRLTDPRFLEMISKIPAPGFFHGLRTETHLIDPDKAPG